MSKRNKRKMIEEVHRHDVPDSDVVELLNIFSYAVDSIAPTLARRAWFELRDFRSAGKGGVGGYSLDLSRKPLGDHEIWIARFQKNEKQLEVIGSLESES